MQAQLAYERHQTDLLLQATDDILRQMAETISAGLSSLHLLPGIITSAATLLGASGGVLSLVETDRVHARVHAVHTLPATLVGAYFPLGQGLTGRVLATGQPAILEEGQSLEQEWWPPREPDDSPRWLVVPISLQGTTLGALSLTASPPQALTPADVPVLALFARYAALAIGNADRYEHAQEVAAQEERQRLARDLHDSVSQTLFGLQYAAQHAWDTWDRRPDRARASLELVLQLARSAMIEMRELLFELRPEVLEREGLAGALERHSALVAHRSGLAVDLQIEGEASLPRTYEEALYRLVQEALANVVKHAQATHVTVRISFGTQIRVRIEDDGVGLHVDETRFDTFGLRGMHERTSRLGGTLAVATRAEGGTYVQVEIPMPAPSDLAVGAGTHPETVPPDVHNAMRRRR